MAIYSNCAGMKEKILRQTHFFTPSGGGRG
ncbi:hypothetical protein MTBLM1_100086 [Rhodospirillaceae bacterium LM-1]|nr:hypothetical protein MTBLM1_100086 [Rhodospirillaceae bacterium LM-1]